MIKLILASNSPRRKQILTDLGLDFEVVPSNYDEKLEDDIFSYEKIEDLATQKCLEIPNERSGATHSVVTSICAINKKTNRAALISTTSYVRFKELSDEMIHYYIDTFNPLDKAGSYGIQELPPNYLDKFEGSFENIVGLCPEAVKSVLTQLEY